MRFLAIILIGAAAGAGAVVALVHDQSTLTPAPARALFQGITPYNPPGLYGTAATAPTPAPSRAAPSTSVGPAGTGSGTRVAYSYGSGG